METLGDQIVDKEQDTMILNLGVIFVSDLERVRTKVRERVHNSIEVKSRGSECAE